jgi:hypothetical protein
VFYPLCFVIFFLIRSDLIYEVIVATSPHSLREASRVSRVLSYFLSAASQGDDWLGVLLSGIAHRLLVAYPELYASDHIEEVRFCIARFFILVFVCVCLLLSILLLS